MATDKKRVSAYVDDDLYDKIKDLANKEDRSISSMVLVILKRYLENK